MPDASDNAVCRLFKVHDFVPLFARMIKIVNQSRETPLFTENRPSRCTDLFRLGMFLFCSDKVLGTTKYRDMEVHGFVPLRVDSPQKGNLHGFVPLLSPLAYAEVPIDGTSRMFRFTTSYSLLFK